MLLGYYVDCDNALCVDCFKRAGGISEWHGFEDWDSPIEILDSESVDCPVHCCDCYAMLPVQLTSYGDNYIIDALREYNNSYPYSGDPEIMDMWAKFLIDTSARRYLDFWPRFTLARYIKIREKENANA